MAEVKYVQYKLSKRVSQKVHKSTVQHIISVD